jgi:N-acetylneuraminic acid mutarotase
MIRYVLISISFFAFLSGCKKDEFDVPDEFKGYVQRFENEGRLRGKIIDIEKQGLKVEFADFTGQDIAGLTKYEDPIRIQIDRTYWNENSDIIREFVMFHELGHGFLGIHDHRNDTLPNGQWKSIMRGPPANYQVHMIEYEKHRDYYLDELFLDNVKHPAWSYRPSIIELISTDTAFGLLPVNSGKSKNLTIKNKGDKQVFINSINASNCFSSNFTGSIQPNDSINVSFLFRPTEQKQYSCVVEINHSILNDTEIQPLTVELIGEGSTSFSIGEWIEKTPFPGAARYEAASFSINGSGFVCLGRTYSNNMTNEIWEYNTDNQWVRKNDFPGESRNLSIGFSIDGKGYLGLGTKRNDFWEYNYSADAWIKKSDFPGQARINSVYFSTSKKGYVGLGYDGYSLFNDFWEYDPVSDKWTQLPNYPGKGNIYAAAFTLNNRIFVGTGCDGEIAAGHANSDFWEYNTSTKQWTRKSDFAGGKTNSAISFSINNYGYLGGGSMEDGNGTDKSFWEYDPAKDKWSKKAYMLNFSSGGAYFSAGNKGYFGIGYMTSPYFWEFNPN